MVRTPRASESTQLGHQAPHARRLREMPGMAVGDEGHREGGDTPNLGPRPYSPDQSKPITASTARARS